METGATPYVSWQHLDRDSLNQITVVLTYLNTELPLKHMQTTTEEMLANGFDFALGERCILKWILFYNILIW